MDAFIVGCYSAPISTPPTATCYCARGYNYGLTVSGVPQVATVLSVARTSTATAITFVVPMLAAGIPTDPNATIRTIFAQGSWVASAVPPMMPHNSLDTKIASLAPFEGGLVQRRKQESGARTAWIVTLAIFGGYLLIGIVLNLVGVVLSNRAITAIQTLGCVTFAAVYSAFVYLSWTDFDANGKPAPIMRAFGSGTVYCFWFILYPTARHLGIATLTGTSYERFLPFHMLAAWLCFLSMTVHLIGMLVWAGGLSGGVSYAFLWEGPSRNNLAGFLAWVFLLLMIIVTFVRRRLFGLFKLSHHVLFVLVLVFAILHENSLIFGLIPPLANYAFDLVMRLISHCCAGPKVIAAAYQEGCGVVELTMSAKLAVEPGQYAFLIVPSVSPNPHPFTISTYDATAQQATFHIKANGPSTWTGKLAQAVGEGKLNAGSSVVLMGPYGKLAVPLSYPRSVVLAAGGIGITPMVSLLAGCAHAPQLAEVHLIWSVRHQSLVDLMSPYILQAKACCEQANKLVILHVHVTAAPLSPRSVGKGLSLSHSNQGNYGVDLEARDSVGDLTLGVQDIELEGSGLQLSSSLGDAELDASTPTSTHQAPSRRRSGRRSLTGSQIASKQQRGSLSVNPGRPDWKGLFDAAGPKDGTLRPLACCACGPPGLIDLVAELSANNSIVLHTEVFVL